MNEMRAAQYDAYGPPEVLRVRTVPVPRLRPGHVLVRVAATSVNGADVAVRSGKLRLLTGRSFPRGAGFDFAGTVAGAAGDVTGLAAGDEVWGFLNGTRGANGGVGTAAVQVARALGGRVTALAGAPHLDRLRDLGAEEAFDYHATDPSELGRFDVVLDPVAKNTRAYRRLLAVGGRMAVMTIGSPGDAAYLVASLVHGSRRVRFVQSPPTAGLLTALAGYVDGKSITPVIEAVYPLDHIAAAHRSLETSGGFGKRVIQVA
jgi:NADPH:quinone reductase-like Zn-dependent oxidoreductase